jgi:hypothetical protein
MALWLAALWLAALWPLRAAVSVLLFIVIPLSYNGNELPFKAAPCSNMARPFCLASEFQAPHLLMQRFELEELVMRGVQQFDVKVPHAGIRLIGYKLTIERRLRFHFFNLLQHLELPVQIGFDGRYLLIYYLY